MILLIVEGKTERRILAAVPLGVFWRLTELRHKKKKIPGGSNTAGDFCANPWRALSGTTRGLRGPT